VEELSPPPVGADEKSEASGLPEASEEAKGEVDDVEVADIPLDEEVLQNDQEQDPPAG
jgi:hypothetical protein